MCYELLLIVSTDKVTSILPSYFLFSHNIIIEGYSATRAFVRNLKYSVLGKVLIFFMLFVYPVTMIGKQYVKISWIR